MIGWGIGFLGLARVVELLFDASSTLASSLFVGLVAGMFPSLFRQVEKKGSGAASWSYFVISLVIFYAFLSSLKAGQTIEITPNTAWYFLCGVIWGLSLVIPGLSSSSIIILLGLYQPMAAGIANVRMDVIFPLFTGIMLSAVGVARLVNILLKKYRAFVHHVTLGIVVASTLLIIPSGFASIGQLVLSIAFFLVGYVISKSMEVLGSLSGNQTEGIPLERNSKRPKLRKVDY
jgi:putative membrane protein